MTTLALGNRLASVGGGNVIPIDPPILRRDLLQEDEFFILLENGTDKIVITFGTFDSLLLEDNTTFLSREDTGKLIIQAN